MNETVRTNQPGDKVGGGRYLLKKILGRGGMGMVWLALDEKLNELVALKFISGPLIHDAAGLAMLRREVARAHRLTHPHILRVHDLHEHAGEDPFIAMEYVEGPTLSQLRAERPQHVLPWSELAPLAAQLCDALAYAHAEGVVHRDLKPGNVMLDHRGRVKLCDFGIAAIISDHTTRLTGSGGVSGTPAYMSPQQMNGDRPAPSDDVYALGAMLYELLTSEPPFAHGNIFHQVQNKEAPTLAQRMTELKVRNALPPQTETVILACLAKEPAKRPKDAREIARRLGVAEGGAANPAPARGKLPLMIAAAVVVLGVVSAVVWFRQKPSPAAVSPSSSSPAYPQPKTWQDVTVHTTRAALTSGKLKQDGDWLTATETVFLPVRNKDQTKAPDDLAVRVLFANKAEVYLRRNDAASGDGYVIGIAGHYAVIAKNESQDSRKNLVPPMDFGTSLADGTEHELVASAVGDRFALWLDGKLLLTATDSTYKSGITQVVMSMRDASLAPRIKKVEIGALDAAAPAVSPSLTPQVSGAASTFPPGKWTKVFTKAEEITSNVFGKTSFTWRDGWIDGTGATQGAGRGILIVPGSKGRNQGLRLHGKLQLPAPSLFACTISVRRSKDSSAPRRYTASIQTDGNLQIGYSTEGQATQEPLAVKRIGPAFASDAEFDLELIVVGNKLYSRFNGQPQPVVTDERLTEGELSIQSNHLLRDVEVINLDGLSEAEALKAAGVATAPAQSPPWSDVTADLRSRGLANGSLKLDGDWLETVRTTWPSPAGNRAFRDFAVRITYANRVEVQFRKNAAGSYAASAEGDVCGLYLADKNNDRQRLSPLTRLTADYNPAVPHEFLLLARGPQLSVWIDGRKQAEAADARYVEGGFSLGLFADGKTRPPRLKTVEYLNLDGLSEAEALKAAGLPAAASAWQRAEFPTQTVTDEIRSNGGVAMDGALLGVWKDAIFRANTNQALRNAAVRITAPAAQPKWPVKIVTRLGTAGQWTQYTLRIWARMVEIALHDQGERTLKTFPLKESLSDGGDFTAQFASLGTQHSVWINGQFIGSITDESLNAPGKLGIQATDGRFKSVELLPLDGLSETAARQFLGLPAPSKP